MKENREVTDTNVEDIEEAKRIIEKLISTMKSDREMFDEKTREKEIYTFFINALEFILSDYKRVLKENNRLEEQVEYDKTHIYTPQTIKLNYIPIQKVKDKIEEILNNGEYRIIFEGDAEFPDDATIIKAQKYIKLEEMQELIEEREEK